MRRLKPDVGPDIVPLSVADMEFVLVPAIRDGLISYMGTVVLGYTGPTPSYSAAIQSWLDRRQNMHIEQEWIETTPGVVDGIGLALQTITEPGDAVIIMTPVYYPFFDLIDLTGCAKLQMELTNTDGRYSIDFARLGELAADPSAKAILLCSPHNPVGRVWSSEELQQAGQIAEKHNLYVLSDEIHGDLIMPGHTFTPFLNACPGWSDRTISFRTCPEITPPVRMETIRIGCRLYQAGKMELCWIDRPKERLFVDPSSRVICCTALTDASVQLPKQGQFAPPCRLCSATVRS